MTRNILHTYNTCANITRYTLAYHIIATQWHITVIRTSIMTHVPFTFITFKLPIQKKMQTCYTDSNLHITKQGVGDVILKGELCCVSKTWQFQHRQDYTVIECIQNCQKEYKISCASVICLSLALSPNKINYDCTTGVSAENDHSVVALFYFAGQKGVKYLASNTCLYWSLENMPLTWIKQGVETAWLIRRFGAKQSN